MGIEKYFNEERKAFLRTSRDVKGAALGAALGLGAVLATGCGYGYLPSDGGSNGGGSGGNGWIDNDSGGSGGGSGGNGGGSGGGSGGNGGGSVNPPIDERCDPASPNSLHVLNAPDLVFYNDGLIETISLDGRFEGGKGPYTSLWTSSSGYNFENNVNNPTIYLPEAGTETTFRFSVLDEGCGLQRSDDVRVEVRHENGGWGGGNVDPCEDSNRFSVVDWGSNKQIVDSGDCVNIWARANGGVEPYRALLTTTRGEILAEDYSNSQGEMSFDVCLQDTTNYHLIIKDNCEYPFVETATADVVIEVRQPSGGNSGGGDNSSLRDVIRNNRTLINNAIAEIRNYDFAFDFEIFDDGSNNPPYVAANFELFGETVLPDYDEFQIGDGVYLELRNQNRNNLEIRVTGDIINIGEQVPEGYFVSIDNYSQGVLGESNGSVDSVTFGAIRRTRIEGVDIDCSFENLLLMNGHITSRRDGVPTGISGGRYMNIPLSSTVGDCQEIVTAGYYSGFNY